MDLLEKQLSILNGEIDGITSDIRGVYSRLDSERNPSLREDFKERITKLETEKTELNDRRRKLGDKLQPGGPPISQKGDDEAADCKVRVTGATGYFDGLLLLDTGCSMELNISERKAYQIGLIEELSQSTCEIGDQSQQGITPRRPACVQIFIEGQNELEQDSNVAYLEVWIDNNTAGSYRPGVSPNAAIQLSCKKRCSPIKDPGKDRNGFDLIIGKPGMRKLGIGIHPRGHIFLKKRVFRK